MIGHVGNIHLISLELLIYSVDNMIDKHSKNFTISWVHRQTNKTICDLYDDNTFLDIHASDTQHRTYCAPHIHNFWGRS